jgi:5-methylcytosine-specific restriction protein A
MSRPARICSYCRRKVAAGVTCPCGQGRERDTRPTASERGYGTDWRKLRATMPKTPCAICGAPWVPGMHLDHIIPRAEGGTDAPSNLQWVHRRCHSAKTAGADGGFGNRKGKGPVKGCDVNGRPLDPNHPWNGGKP